jgi:hypothetical protein
VSVLKRLMNERAGIPRPACDDGSGARPIGASPDSTNLLRRSQLRSTRKRNGGGRRS